MNATCNACGRTFDMFEETEASSAEVSGALGTIDLIVCGNCSDELGTLVLDAEETLREQEKAMDEASEERAFEREQAREEPSQLSDEEMEELVREHLERYGEPVRFVSQNSLVDSVPCECHGFPIFDCPTRWEEGPILIECQEDYESQRYWREQELEEVHPAAAYCRMGDWQPWEDFQADRFSAKFDM